MSPAPPVRPALFLDRDGVLNHDDGFVHRPEQVRWIAGAASTVARARAAGMRVFVVTNQSGVARGLFGVDAVEALHRWMGAELAARGAPVDAWRYAPHHPDALDPRWRHPDPPWRKPNPGMLEDLMAAFPTDRARSLLIGDRPSDMAAARAAGVEGLRFTGGDLDAALAGWLARRGFASGAASGYTDAAEEGMRG